MAKGRKTGGRDIKPGQVLNPKGHKAYPEGTRNLAKWSAIAFRAYILEYLAMTMDELKATLEDPTAQVIDRLVGSVLYEAINRGDHQRMNAILDRCIGKVSENLNVTTDKPFILEKLNGAVIEMGMKREET